MLQEITEGTNPETGKAQVRFIFTEGMLAFDTPVGLPTVEALKVLEAAIQLAKEVVLPKDPATLN